MSSEAVDTNEVGSDSSIEHLAAEPDDILDKLDKKLDCALNNTNTMPNVAKRTLANNLKRKPEAPPREDRQNKKLKTKNLLKEILDRIGHIEELLVNNRDVSAPSPRQDTTASSSKEADNNCIFCNRFHYSNDCRAYRSLSDRKRTCREKKRCERCLCLADHVSSSCRNKSTCFYCKHAKRETDMYKHNSAFCPYYFNK